MTFKYYFPIALSLILLLEMPDLSGLNAIQESDVQIHRTRQVQIAKDTLPRILLKNVNLVPMTSDTVFRNQTVLIENSIIHLPFSVEKFEKRPTDVVIDGTGKYLFPGLSDMHVHIFSEDELILYVANGVTTVRNMWGWDMHLSLKEKIASGSLIGPDIVTAGSIIDGDPPRLRGSAVVTSAEQAEQEAIDQIQQGYNFLKVYDRINPEAYFALLQFAEQYGGTVQGHVPEEVGVYGAIRGGQKAIDHFEGYPKVITVEDSTVKNPWEQNLSDHSMDLVIDATLDHRVWNIPTVVVFDRAEMSAVDSKEFLQRDELKYLPPFYKRFCCESAYDPKNDLPKDIIEKRRENRLTLLKTLHKRGANLLIGADTGNRFVLPGYSIHSEIQNFLDAGISVYETLRYATVEPAKFLGTFATSGTIEAGKSTDLLLLSDNPLNNVETLKNPAGVIINGKWVSESQISDVLKENAERFSDK